jgi:hypothetical protein
MPEQRHFHGVVSRFSAGRKDVTYWTKLADSLKTDLAAGSRVRARGVNISSTDLQELIASLRQRGINVSPDGVLSSAGPGLVVFSTSPMTTQSLIALANSVNRAPAGRRVIDCEGYAYLSQSLL